MRPSHLQRDAAVIVSLMLPQACVDMVHWMAEQIGIDADRFQPSR